MAPGTNLLLTGPPGIGKSTILTAVSRRLPSVLESRAAGILSRELCEGNRRVGFGLQPLEGEPRVMAHRDLVSSQRVTGYGVDVEVINYVVDLALGEPAAAGAALFLIDEIGLMECCSPRFVAAVGRLLEDPRPLVATVAQRGDGLVAQVKTRSDVELWSVDLDNRAGIPRLVREWLAR